MSEDLKKALCTLLQFLEIIAKQTKNPIDDIIIKGLKAMLGCK